MTSQNDVLLEGTPLESPVWSHDNHGLSFCRFPLQVPRLSGTPDTLPILLPQALAGRVRPGEPLALRGQLRSFNNRSGVGSRLVLTVHVRELPPLTGEPRNTITLAGSLCKTPIFRRTPLGRSICDCLLAVPRRYGRADYLPVIAWGQLASACSRLKVGDPLALEGRVQSRVYRKVTELGEEERVAYEVSVMHLLTGDDPGRT